MPMTPMTASSRIVEGSAMTISVSRLVTCSVRRPRWAAISASGMPMPKATSTVSVETSSGSRAGGEDPAEDVAARCGSVPSQWAAEGTASRLARSCSSTS